MLDRVEMHVIQMPPKVVIIPDDVIVITRLPEACRNQTDVAQPGLGRALEASNQLGHSNAGIRAEQQMQMIVQQHVGMMDERIKIPNSAQGRKGFPASLGTPHPRSPSLGSQGQEDGLPVTEVASIARHAGRMTRYRMR